MLDRLALNPQRIDGIAAGLRQVAGLPDPIGAVLSGRTLPNGLQIRQQRVPLGVVGIVYEGRPNVTVDAFGLTCKSGNAVLLRGSSSAARSNAELVTALRGALCGEGLPADAVQLLPSADRSSVTHLIQARGLVDVVPPEDVTAIVNTGDDMVLHGLAISPDIDTVIYTLADAIDPERGWGLRDESWQAMEALSRYGGVTWFRLGDRDLATGGAQLKDLATGDQEAIALDRPVAALKENLQ